MGFFKRFTEKNNKPNKNDNKPKLKVGLALGGGGTRGFAHLGALRAFEEEGISFDYIAGTSVGSLVGAMYASGMSVEDMVEASKGLKPKDIKTSKVLFVPSKTEKLEELLKRYIGDAVFSDLKIPLSIIAVDLVTASEVELSSGSVIKAVAGSCAIPAVFNPVEFGDYLLVDGGVMNTIPSDVMRNRGCKYIIAVDVNPGRGYGSKSSKLIDVMATTIRIMMKANADKGRMYADIVIDPDTKRFKSSKTVGSDEMIEEGYKATMAMMPEIKKLLKIRTKPTLKDKALEYNLKKKAEKLVKKENKAKIKTEKLKMETPIVEVEKIED
jgi:NTE family protein